MSARRTPPSRATCWRGQFNIRWVVLMEVRPLRWVLETLTSGLASALAGPSKGKSNRGHGKWGAVHPETSEHAPTKTFDNHCHALALYFERQRRFPGQHPHDARDSGSSLGAAPWSKFALQRQPSVRQAALEQLPTPMPFTTGSFRACASASRTANNGVHQLSLRARKIM